MANLTLLHNLTWSIRTQPKAELTENWKEVVLPHHNFKIIYQVASPGDDLIESVVPYNTEGIPVTLEDLLTTIYEFYEEPLEHHDPLYQEGKSVKRSDPLGKQHTFASLEEISTHTYRLILTSAEN